MTEQVINSYILKLSGRAELPKEIEPGHNYHISLEGSIPKMELHDNEDGTWNKVYLFRPVKVELLNSKGESLKLKDTRKKSQLWRAQVWKRHSESDSNLSFEDFYERLMVNMIQHSSEIVEMYGQDK